jgi:hypothetical protein
MSNAKPLSKERREEIEHWREVMYGMTPTWESVVNDALAAEQYWREAVKNAPAIPNEDFCQFCPSHVNWDGDKTSITHKPDCPWLLAQETK